MYAAMTVAITLIAVFAVKLVLALILSKGNLQRLKLSLRTSLKVLNNDDFADKIEGLLNPPTKEAEQLDPRPIRLLSILQRDGRLIDFLMEELGHASDEQIAAGVREIHKDCRRVLDEHLQLENVLADSEGDTVEIPAGFDPSAIQLTGNVTGDPPFKGRLSHPGWRVKEIKLVQPAEGVDELVLQPAEVELP